jgi:hypothetical protein
MSHHSRLDNRQLDPLLERTIRRALRAMGAMALAACLIFWLSLLFQ